MEKLICKNTLLLAAILFCSCNFSKNNNQNVEYFEGVVYYRLIYDSKNPTFTNMYMEDNFGKKSSYFFKEGGFKESTDKGFMTYVIYKREENKLFFKKDSTNTLYWVDCNLENEKIINYKVTKNKETIMGYICDELFIKTDKNESYYYYTNKFNINPEWYNLYKRYSIDFVMRKTKAIILKNIIRFPDLIMIREAEKIEARKIDDDEIGLPKNAVIIKDALPPARADMLSGRKDK